jgi:hypothetical protein
MRLLTAVASLMLLVFSVGCRSFMARNSPNYVLNQGEWNSRSTNHFVFYFRPGSRTERQINIIADRQENNYKEILGLLQASDPDCKIRVFIFPTLEDKIHITSSWAYAHTIGDYHTVYCIDRDTIRNVVGRREVTHLLLGEVWGPCAGGPFSWIMMEGIPVWADEDWFRMELFKYAEIIFANGNIITPYDIAMDSKISERNTLAYPVAGAFVKYLVQKYGLEKLVQLYREGHSQKDFLRIFGLEFPEASEQFVNYILSP